MDGSRKILYWYVCGMIPFSLYKCLSNTFDQLPLFWLPNWPLGNSWNMPRGSQVLGLKCVMLSQEGSSIWDNYLRISILKIVMHQCTQPFHQHDFHSYLPFTPSKTYINSTYILDHNMKVFLPKLLGFSAFSRFVSWQWRENAILHIIL